MKVGIIVVRVIFVDLIFSLRFVIKIGFKYWL